MSCTRKGLFVGVLAIIALAVAHSAFAAIANQTASKPILGTANDDILRGTKRADIIYGKAGNDTIYGLAGNDRIFGGPGADHIFCGPGNDTVYADKNDTLSGCEKVIGIPQPPPPQSYFCNGKQATIVGTAGNDTLTGTAGDDVIVGLAGDDVIEGLNGNDVLCGNEGDDRIDGGAGEDFTDSGEGFDACLNAETGENCSSPPVFTFIESFPDAERAIVAQALTFTIQQIRAYTSAAVDGFSVVVEDSSPNSDTGFATYEGAIHLFAHGNTWQWTSYPPYFKYVLIAHEYFHLVQSGLAQKRSYLTDKWIREGSAEFIGYLVASASGLIDLSQAVSQKRNAANAASGSLTTCAWPCEYNLGFVATDFLLSQNGGWPALISFWKLLGNGLSWQDAFQQAFGKDLQTFYTEFDAYRATL